MIRVLLVEEADLVRGALAALLTREKDIEVVPAPPEFGHTVAQALSYRPDVVVIDVDGEEDHALGTSLELSARLPECRTLLVVGSATPEYLRRALARRVSGLIGRNSPCDTLPEGVRKVAAGERFIDPGLALLALSSAENPLTDREREVLRLAADGTPTREIADLLSLCVGTVRNHLNAVSRKTGARNRIDAIRIARESGWL
ncbi:response regulator transcription factor [Streptomyces cyaneochromogenes]|uniref:Response regulator transcription factor n=1 Tax=Streptomyces cyaneochromogenes TaxID=2496836 RepID=A0A3S9MNP9_9ACTN|nr:response regulator transcription factor [Streptomyces cyaneochromogenes]AZQ40812.1 response regulator transcription factor [Streptomyces cyaneochromogenes]